MVNEYRSARKMDNHLNNCRVTFGQMLSSIRLCDGSSVRIFAKKLGINPEELEQIENGKILLGPKRAIEFAERLKGKPEVFVQYLLQDQIDSLGLKCKVRLEKEYKYPKSNSIRFF